MCKTIIEREIIAKIKLVGLGFKGGYSDFSHLTELKNIFMTEIYMKKTIQIISN